MPSAPGGTAAISSESIVGAGRYGFLNLLRHSETMAKAREKEKTLTSAWRTMPCSLISSPPMKGAHERRLLS
jgi:hypothetical protein